MIPSSPQTAGNTPLVPLLKIVKPHHILPSVCSIHAKCEYRNPSGSIWDRLVLHELSREENNSTAFITGGINSLCMSLAWSGAASPASFGTGYASDITYAILPGAPLEPFQQSTVQGYGANLVLSLAQDPYKTSTEECLEKHIKEVESNTKIEHCRILPHKQTQAYVSLAQELASEEPWDLIVCPGQDLTLLETLRNKFPQPATLVALDLSKNTFTETVNHGNLSLDGVKWATLTDAECYDMARRLLREEGLHVGPISGGIMAAAIKEITNSPTVLYTKILVIFPDSLESTSRQFLSKEWMVEKEFYQEADLESMYWWYGMSIENLNAPKVFVCPANVQIKTVIELMTSFGNERCVVVENVESNEVVGVATKSLLEQCDITETCGEVCIKKFGVVDSKETLTSLEKLFQDNYWVVNVHKVEWHKGGDEEITKTSDVIGAINQSDLVEYKKKIEKHHLSQYGMAMSDGIPSEMWLTAFDKHVNKKN